MLGCDGFTANLKLELVYILLLVPQTRWFLHIVPTAVAAQKQSQTAPDTPLFRQREWRSPRLLAPGYTPLTP